MSSVPKDVHGAARLVAALRDLQPPLRATGMGAVAPIRQRVGAIDSGRRRRIAVTRSIDGAALGRTPSARGNAAGHEALAGSRLERRDVSHNGSAQEVTWVSANDQERWVRVVAGIRQ